MLSFGVLCPGWIELSRSDDSREPNSTGHSAGLDVSATSCSGSLGVASRSLMHVNISGCELMLSYSIVALDN